MCINEKEIGKPQLTTFLAKMIFTVLISNCLLHDNPNKKIQQLPSTSKMNPVYKFTLNLSKIYFNIITPTTITFQWLPTKILRMSHINFLDSIALMN